ncbi:hypothetical protein HU230_0007910 [Bradyrhizobium quebecense]|uniref:Uncharacterized protein n=1 Tax=Bradyrhizobium quebecense TaxID=2748629 RepID=A0A974AFH8_9BRAD|nr:hypothetical protein [Bradyrhizobium quebecense]UGA45951.1 hypothetical protein HU230_0007910 [Bradyrhizobium quebecense]
MKIGIPSDYRTALAAGRLVARDFIWFVVRDRTTGAPVSDGYWSDLGSTTVDVIDPESGLVANRTFAGASSMISISDIPLVSTLTVQNVTVKLSQVSDRVNELVRGYDCKQGKVQIFRGLFDPDTNVMVGPAAPRFAGTIDEAPITTPPQGEIGDVSLSCTSNTQELTRSNPDTACDASQRLRSSTDNFFADVAVVGQWQQFWGKAGGPIRTNPLSGSALGAMGAHMLWG